MVMNAQQRGVQADLVALDVKCWPLGLDAVAHRLELHGAHGEHLGDEAVELVEAAPGAGGGEALEDVAHRR